MKAKTLAGQATQPSAWIVVNNQKDKSKPSDRGRKSIKNGKVYLDDGEEFEIELYNPLQECVLCDIKLNGQSISKTGLVLRPGQRFYLDCFVDDKKKFIFKTYEVDDNQESSDAISKNGSLEVFFYKEDIVQLNNWQQRFEPIIIERYYPVYYPRWYYYPNIWYGTNMPIYCGSTTTNLINPTVGGTTLSSGIVGTTTAYGTTYTNDSNSCSSIYTSNSNSNTINLNGLLNTSLNSTPISSSIETGRVEKGLTSNQKFDEVDMQFQTYYIAHTVLQILPNSRKPVETNEIKFNDGTGEVKVGESNDIITLIKKLADLHSAGILTDDEFNAKKSELLSRI